MNISSIVVQTLPKYLDSVIENLKKSGVCDYHMHDEKGRIIITIEGKNVEEELKKLKVIEAIPYVSSADMQMSYSEEELANHMEVLENADLVPKVLNDKDIKVEDMIYRGDLKRKDLIGFAKEFDRTEK
ncbi:nitrate reductase [Arcobacter cryaerophilus gv. occultus]|jgi:nitrate reductase NapD|uniref:Chaperone NapD n=3 Tax=unclassified Arcobacter TaxID=2593671 RepID=A0AA96DJR8_9BACT|nr:chaperone NapD [Aliarcobacter cryaerophilus]PRM92114.1 nitrate reductase [Arcobacter cryaerophilus gv. occultus]WNL28752.1 chaperone NapD [Arcobacter sp. AZ-2023]WPD06154.1 chaperone NapD [Arcobacter sp. DSM 115956]WPD08245.1 chaperone NapD [Arcobacter sp. DSM 115955]WNL32510.1 chaperone NapD [Arcobacter sp. AZ-2023]